MSETESPPAPPAPVKKVKIGFKRKMALLHILERKKFSDAVDYKSIAAKTGVSADSLKTLYCQYTHGRVDLGAPQTLEERRIDARTQHETLVLYCQRYAALLLNCAEGALLRAEEMAADGNTPNSWHIVGLPRVTKELREVLHMKADAEKGYVAAIDEIMAMQRQPEKQITLPVSDAVKTQIVGANEEQRALAALGVFEECKTT